MHLFQKDRIPPFVFAIVVLGVAAGVSGWTSLSSGPNSYRQSVTIATYRSPDSLPVWVAAEQGFFDQEGLNVTTRQFSTALLAVLALEQGGADLAGASTESVFKLAANEGIYLKLVHVTTNSIPGSTQLVVRSDLAVNSLEDLKGRTIGVDDYGVRCIECLSFLTLLTDNGFDLDRDLTITKVAHSSMGAALQAGIIDAATMIQPYATLAISQGYGRALQDPRLGELGDAAIEVFSFPLSISGSVANQTAWAGIAGLWTTEEHVLNNSSTVHSVARAIARASSWLMDPRNTDRRAEILTKYVGGLGNPTLFNFASKATLAYQVWKAYPDGYTDWHALERDAQIMLRLGVINADLDVGRFVSMPWFNTSISS